MPKTIEWRNKKRKRRFPGLCADARALGCHRSTLYKVLMGQMPELKGLPARYALLKKTQASQPVTTPEGSA